MGVQRGEESALPWCHVPLWILKTLAWSSGIRVLPSIWVICFTGCFEKELCRFYSVLLLPLRASYPKRRASLCSRQVYDPCVARRRPGAPGIYKEQSVMCSDTLAISRASGSETAKESWCLSIEENTFFDGLLLFSLWRLISASGSERRGREKSVFGVLCPRKSVSG